MYPPASGAGADRRQDLQPEVFILQLVASSAWGMNEPSLTHHEPLGDHGGAVVTGTTVRFQEWSRFRVETTWNIPPLCSTIRSAVSISFTVLSNRPGKRPENHR